VHDYPAALQHIGSLYESQRVAHVFSCQVEDPSWIFWSWNGKPIA
jgi:hypothetical protein